jgi:hypothetical protein
MNAQKERILIFQNKKQVMKMSEFGWKMRVETTNHDFKKELETKKAKSWLNQMAG